MKNVAVFFGGRTAEHEVSIVTAMQCMENLDAKKYQIIPIYIDREGLWHTGPTLRRLENLQHFKADQAKRCYLPAEPGAKLCVRAKKAFGEKVEEQPIDVAMLAMHGLHGEDGTLQGLLELCDIPYTSCNVGASAGGMDKILMKHVFRGVGLPVLPDVAVTRDAWETAREATVAAIEKALPYPVFIKPAVLGSSIGVGCAGDREALVNCMAVACHYAARILVERAVVSPREVNCAALGQGEQVLISAIEEPLRAEAFLSFSDKYLSGGKQKGMKSLKRKMPADLPEEVSQAVRDYTRRCFAALDCKGVARVDFILEGDDIYVNEINTIPGSMAFYLWEPQGIGFGQLLDRLIAIAEADTNDKKRSQYAFSSGILGQFTSGKS